MTIERLATGYIPDFDIDAEVGHQGEIFVQNVLAALASGAAVEVKADAMYWKTGNVFIEYGCFRQGRWQASGIAKTASEVWCITFPDGGALCVSTYKLREVARNLKQDPNRCKRGGEKGKYPTKGVVVSLTALLDLLRQIDDPSNEEAAA